MRILLTGAAGLTGGESCRQLLARGHAVTAVVRRPEQRGLVPRGAEIVLADCADASAMNELLEGHDSFVHVAGITLGHLLAGLPALASPGRIVVVSSAAVHSRHRASASVYRAGEDALRGARADTVLLRPTMIYGSRRDRNMHHVLRFARRYRFLPVFGDGSALVQPVHFEDVAAAVAALVTARATGTIEIGAESPLPVRAASAAILLAVGAPERLLRVPIGPAAAVARLVDAIRGSRLTERIERMREDRTAENAAVIAATGVRPRSFAVGIRQQAEADLSGAT